MLRMGTSRLRRGFCLSTIRNSELDLDLWIGLGALTYNLVVLCIQLLETSR